MRYVETHAQGRDHELLCIMQSGGVVSNGPSLTPKKTKRKKKKGRGHHHSPANVLCPPQQLSEQGEVVEQEDAQEVVTIVGP